MVAASAWFSKRGDAELFAPGADGRPHESEDASSFEQIRSANRNSNAVEWVELVEYDERALCEERHRVKPPSKKNAKWETCDRAQGAFAVASIRLAQYARELRQWRRAPGPSL